MQVISISFTVFILFIVFSFTNSLKGKNGKCAQTNACKCTFPGGMYYDLSKLRDVNFGWLKLNGETDLFYTPCKDSLIIDTNEKSGSRNDCNSGSGVTLCLRSNSTTMKYSGLTLSTSEFESIDKSIPVSLKFEKVLDDKRTIITINLVCDVSALQPDLKVISSNKTSGDEFVLQLSSPDSCLKNEFSLGEEDEMSTGSKLIIIFLVLLSAYFGGGVLALKYIRGAEGYEMIPNYEFWSDLPYLVRDGVLFLVSGFQVTPSYDRI